MSRSSTAVVLSALLLQGAGQLYLKHYWRGMAYVGVSLTCLWFIVVRAMEQASAVLVQIESHEGALSADQMAEWVSQAQSGSGNTVAALAVWALLVCWVMGIIDAYRLGKREGGRTPLVQGVHVAFLTVVHADAQAASTG